MAALLADFKHCAYKISRLCFFVLLHLYHPVMRKRRWRVFWTNRHSLRCCRFPSFPVAFLLSKSPSRDNCRKAPYHRTQQCDATKEEVEHSRVRVEITRFP